MGFFTRHVRVLLLLTAVVVGAVCVSNGNNPSALVGQWVVAYGELDMELFKDGTGTYDGDSITWKVENKRFVLTPRVGNIVVADYNLSGYELTMTYDVGVMAVWVRKDKKEEYKKKKEEEKRKEEEQKIEEEKQRIEQLSSYFTDSRNGQKYRAVKIGGKTWMAENLNYQVGTSWCYENDNSNCQKYGRLYDWATAKTACPSGWHLPSGEEWIALEIAAGGDVAGKALKAATGWLSIEVGTDSHGFSALPGGAYLVSVFAPARSGGYWWSAAERSDVGAYYRSMSSVSDKVSDGYGVKWNGFSVRCVAND